MKNVLGIIISFGLCGAGYAAPISLYSANRDVKDQGIALKAWGSGTISETDEMAYEGTHSVRISTRNFFQGGRLVMASPVDVASVFGDKNNLLMIVVKLADSSTTYGGGGGAPIGPGGGPSGPPGGGKGGRSGGSMGTAGGGPSGPPGMAGGIGGGRGGGQTGSTTAPPLRNLRFLVTTTDGLRSEAYVPVSTAGSGENGWRQVGLPLQAINGFDRTNKVIKEVAFAGDSSATFYLGELRIINDATPLHGEPNVRDLNLALGDEIELIGYGFGGASILKYTWDFDDTDGIQADAEGQVVKRRFRKPGTFTLTLTVSDVYGLKTPYSTTIKAVVNP